MSTYVTSGFKDRTIWHGVAVVWLCTYIPLSRIMEKSCCLYKRTVIVVTTETVY
jgi:hypothetical protein